MDRMSKGQNKQLLHYGCLVYLTYKDENGLEYLMTADGYTKNKILLKKKEDILSVSSISTCLFKIYPTFYNNEYVKARRKYDEKRKFKHFTTIELRDSQLEIPKQIKAMEDETSLNYEQYDKYKSSPVVFGQTIQLLHINSNKYLFYDSNHVSEYESNNLKLSLKDEHSDETCYRIMACYTFQQEGSGNIYDQDIVNIVSTVDQTKKIGGEPYLHASKPKSFENRRGETKEKREVNISTEKRTPWKINIFSEYLDERDGFLSVQDTIWVNYSEQDLNLIAFRDQVQSGHHHHHSKKGLNIQFEQCSSNANYTKFVGNSNGLFTIESESIFDGGLVKWDQPLITTSYRLRHLTTKQYLQVTELNNPMGDEHTEYALTSVGDYKQASLFQFELIFSTLTTYNRDKAQIYLQKDSYFRASTQVDNSSVWLKVGAMRLLSEQLDKQSEKQHNPTIPTFSKVKKEEFVFKLAKANFNEVRMTNFLLSCLKTIKGAEQYLSPQFLSESNMNDERFQSKYKGFLSHMTRLERCLSDLQLFCNNKLIAYLYIDQEYGQVNNFIQNVLREQQFIELQVKILCLSFPDRESLLKLQEIETSEAQLDQSKRQRKHDDSSKSRMVQIRKEYFTRKKKVCSQIYKLLDCICKQNTTNQRQAARFMPIFAQQSLFINEALDCIIQIIRDDEDLLLNIHKQVSINNNGEVVSNHGMEQNMTIEEYYEQYDLIVATLNTRTVDVQWDLLLFFTNLLKDKKQSTSKKRDIISFLQFASTHRSKGLNVNQERIYKCLLGHGDKEELFRNEVLIRFEAQQNTIKVYVQGEEMIFVEFFSSKQGKKVKNHQEDDDEIGKSKQLSNFLKKQGIQTPSQTLSPKLILSLVSEQMEFFISMCNTRNNTWRKFVESFLPYGVLIANLGEDVIGYDMRAIICKLLNKVYIDQEPRRELIFPELCKVVPTNEAPDINLMEKELLNIDGIDLNYIKDTILQYITQRGNETERLSNLWDLKDGDTKKVENLKRISADCERIYNKLTLEVIRLLKLMINFGKYTVRPDADKDSNKDFFAIIKSLFIMLEFDPAYPETRKILIEKRTEDLKKKDKIGGQQLLQNALGIFGDVMGALNVFQLIDETDPNKDKKKKTKAIQFESGPLNMNESFLKQADVLKKILSKFLQESQDTDQLIKLEICDILNQYLDQKMDFCLNHFKLKFKEYVTKLNLIRQLEEGEINLNEDRKVVEDQFKQVMKDCIQALIPQIFKTGTTADERLNPKKNDFGLSAFGNLANLGNIAAQFQNVVEPQGASKEIEAIDISTILGFEIFPTLICLFCMTQSLDMQTKLLNILTRFYNQREEFADLASKMLLLFDEQNIKIFQELKGKLRILAKNIDESETWIQYPEDQDNQHTLRQTTNYFVYINNLLYEDSYLEHDSVKTIQTVKVDEFRQSIMRNLKVYELCIQLIRDSIGVTQQNFPPQTRQMVVDLFKACFKFLRNFTVNNPTNQLILSEHLTKFSLHMDVDLGQVDLLNEIFRNNKKICIEKPSLLIDVFRKIIKTKGRQARFLEFFTIIQRVKKEYLSSNQKAVLNMLLDPAYKNQIFWLKDRQAHPGEKQQQQLVIKHEFDLQPHKSDDPTYKDEPYIYQAALIEVLYSCAIGKEGMLQNETRLRMIISIKYALELLSSPDNMTDNNHSIINHRYDKEKVVMLKIPMLHYVYFTYLESEKLSDDMFKCISDVQEYVMAEQARIERMTVAPQEDFVEYFYTLFFTCMTGFLKLYQRELVEQNMVHQNQAQVHAEINQLMDSVKKLRDTIEHCVLLKEIQLTPAQEQLKVYFFSDNIIEEEKLLQMQKDEHEKMKQEEEAKEAELLKKQKQKGKSLQFAFPVLQKEKKPKPENFKPDEAWKQLWNLFLQTFLNSDELSTEIRSEQNLFADALDKVEKIYVKDPSIADHINKNEIFKKLIIFLSKGHNQPGCEQCVKQVLRALSNYIIISQDLEAPEDDEEKQEAKKKQAQEDHQNFLNSNNAMATILFILSDYKDPERSNSLFNNLLCFGIQMLEGGNRDVQKSVYNFFVNYTSSEVFFMRLHDKFDVATIDILKEDEDDQIESYAYKDDSDEIVNTLRFLQLLVEGHYTELQNYMRFQQMNYHTYDLFTDVAELLGSYLNAKKSKYFNSMIQCFDTITEYVQGPCFDNQIALFQANFLDMAQNLLGVDERLEELESKIVKRKSVDQMDLQNRKGHEILPRWMYARLKYKCSITLLSILEARKSNELVIRLAKSLSFDMLKRNIVDVFDMFKSQYSNDYCEEVFGHFKKDPKGNEITELEYSSFIIETGFNLFVLYSIFLESRDVDENADKKASEKKEDIMEQLKTNIIGELIYLAISIVQGLNEVALNIAQNINNAIMGGSGEIDYNEVKNQLMKRRASLFKDSMKFFTKNSAHIEVLRDDKMLEKVYFYLLPFCSGLDKGTKTEFNKAAKRISVKAKVTSLLTDSKELIKKMKLNYQINLYLNKIKVLALIVSKINLYRDITFLLALTINIMILFVFHKDPKQCDPNADNYQGCLDDYYDQLDVMETDQQLQGIIQTLGIIVIVLSMLIVLFFLAQTAPLIMKKAWVGWENDKLNLLKYIKRVLMTVVYLITDFYVLYYLSYGFTAFLGTLYHPFFFAFQLFDVLVRYPVLLNVVKAVWEPRSSILFTLFLFIVLMYVFSLVAYYWLYESYEPNFCYSTLQCLLTAVDRSFKSDGGLGGFLTPSTDVHPNDNGYFMFRFFFDNVYFILLMIIMINIVSGIIIDTFGTLREDLKNFNFDLINNCFICGFDKETIEKSSKNQQGFQYHIKQEHYMWNYLCYIAYLKNKDSTEFTGIESYVADKISNEDISWFPTFKALCMNADAEEQEQAQVLTQLETIKSEQEKLQELLDNINQQLEKIEEEHNLIQQQ